MLALLKSGRGDAAVSLWKPCLERDCGHALRGYVDHERPAAKVFLIEHRVGPPQILLTVPVAL